jgi:hypothetical protein
MSITLTEEDREFISNVIFDYIIDNFEFNKERIQANDISLASYKIAFKEIYKTAFSCLQLINKSAYNYLTQYIDKY